MNRIGRKTGFWTEIGRKCDQIKEAIGIRQKKETQTEKERERWINGKCSFFINLIREKGVLGLFFCSCLDLSDEAECRD